MTADLILSQLSANIVLLRTARGLSQAELAERAKLSAGFINDLERSRKWISPKSLASLATALGVEPHRLLEPTKELNRDDRISTMGAVERELRARMEETVSDVLSRYYTAEDEKEGGEEVGTSPHEIDEASVASEKD